MTTNDQLERLKRLSPEKRALVLQALREQAAGAQRANAIPRQADGAPAPLSFAQQRLWFVDQVDSGGSSYNVAAGLRLDGPLEVAALERTLNAIIQRHEALRTTFRAVDGDPTQVIAPSLRLEIPLVDLEHLPRVERDAAARRLASEQSQQHFDLARGPLVRASLLRLATDQHLLTLAMHHSISDGWSLGVFFHELAALYAACLAGRPSPLAALPVQYADYAAWQREWLQGPVLKEQLAYWERQLAGAPTTLDLPIDRPRPPLQSFRGATYSFRLSASLSLALKTLGRQQDATPFMTLLAGFQALLGRYTGQEDLMVGSPIAGRTRAEVEGLIGCFVNTLALRADLRGDPSFRELLGRVREATLGAYAHQELPFERLVEALQPERDPSRHPIFQVMFALQNAPTEPPRLPGLTVQLFDLESVTSPFDLTLLLEETEDGLTGLVEYSTDLFDPDTVARLAGHFETLLTGVVADPERRLSELPLLTDTERSQLAAWNATAAPYPADATIPQLFEAQAERTPDAVAVVWGDKRLSYRELNERANRLAHSLRRLGVGPEVRVGLCVERSLDLAVGLLGVLKAGGAYLPLDPSYPRERLAYMLADAGAPVLLTQRVLVERLPETDARLVCLDENQCVWQASAARAVGIAETDRPAAADVLTNPDPTATPDDLAYVIYTSGSTGRPKGVLVPHRGLLNHTTAVGRHYGLGPEDRVLQFASISFDVMAEELFPAWLNGATVVLRPDQVLTSFAELARLLEQERLTVLNLPTPYWHEWVAELALAGARPPASLRLVVSGSDRALPERLALWRNIVGDRVHWMNAYGPTEATITATVYDLPGSDPGRKAATVPIGRPIANTQVHILDPRGRPLPVGVPGELYIGGIDLARGYLNRPELTAEKFIPDPFSVTPGARLYRTGDLARWLPDGNLEFLGRVDQQIKMRGFRIELGEIEAALAEHPAIRECAVVAREDQPGSPCLVAYLVPSPSSPSPDHLRAFLKERLPDYMVPAAFVTLAALPLMPNGKLDRHALPAPGLARSDAAAAYVAPRTAAEQAIAAIWQEVLGLPRVGLDDNFFDLGGHSLLLVRVHARLRAGFGAELSLVDLFKHSTVSALAEALTGPDPEPALESRVHERAASRRELMARQRQLRQRYQA